MSGILPRRCPRKRHPKRFHPKRSVISLFRNTLRALLRQKKSRSANAAESDGKMLRNAKSLVSCKDNKIRPQKQTRAADRLCRTETSAFRRRRAGPLPQRPRFDDAGKYGLRDAPATGTASRLRPPPAQTGGGDCRFRKLAHHPVRLHRERAFAATPQRLQSVSGS